MEVSGKSEGVWERLRSRKSLDGKVRQRGHGKEVAEADRPLVTRDGGCPALRPGTRMRGRISGCLRMMQRDFVVAEHKGDITLFPRENQGQKKAGPQPKQ